jgi:hypothetical protein
MYVVTLGIEKKKRVFRDFKIGGVQQRWTPWHPCLAPGTSGQAQPSAAGIFLPHSLHVLEDKYRLRVAPRTEA